MWKFVSKVQPDGTITKPPYDKKPNMILPDLNRADYLSNVYTSSFTKEVSTKTFRRFYNTGQGCTYPAEQLPAL